MQCITTAVVEFEGSWESMDTCEPMGEGVPRAEEVVRRAQLLVESHPQFIGRSRLFEFECVDDTLVIRGAVPTFYLKQMLQSTLKSLDGVRVIDNRVSVDTSYGFSLPQRRNFLT